MTPRIETDTFPFAGESKNYRLTITPLDPKAKNLLAEWQPDGDANATLRALVWDCALQEPKDAHGLLVALPQWHEAAETDAFRALEAMACGVATEHTHAPQLSLEDDSCCVLYVFSDEATYTKACAAWGNFWAQQGLTPGVLAPVTVNLGPA